MLGRLQVSSCSVLLCTWVFCDTGTTSWLCCDSSSCSSVVARDGRLREYDTAAFCRKEEEPEGEA